MKPSDLVFLPAWPYRVAYWVLDTPLVRVIRRGARRKYGLE
jgi:hypothetical protein